MDPDLEAVETTRRAPVRVELKRTPEEWEAVLERARRNAARQGLFLAPFSVLHGEDEDRRMGR